MQATSYQLDLSLLWLGDSTVPTQLLQGHVLGWNTPWKGGGHWWGQMMHCLLDGWSSMWCSYCQPCLQQTRTTGSHSGWHLMHPPQWCSRSHWLSVAHWLVQRQMEELHRQCMSKRWGLHMPRILNNRLIPCGCIHDKRIRIQYTCDYR